VKESTLKLEIVTGSAVLYVTSYSVRKLHL